MKHPLPVWNNSGMPFLAEYLRSQTAAGISNSTLANYKRTLLAFLRFVPPDRPPTHDDVHNYLADALSSCRLKPITAHNHRSHILAFLAWLSDVGAIPEPPKPWSKLVRRVRVPPQQVRSLTIDECRRLVAAVEGANYSTRLAATRNTAMLYLLLDSAIREGELINLRLSQLDLDNRTIRLTNTKGRSDRVACFGVQTLAKLRKYLRVRRRPRSPWLWVTRSTDKASTALVYQIVKRLGYAAGIPDVTVHMLRHTAATLLHRQGMSPLLLMRLLGHRNLATTLIYTELDDSDLLDAYAGRSPVEVIRG